jgi:O-6-methylguanine DNA methyltransferase
MRFYSYGENILDSYEKRVAIRTGFADIYGNLLPQGSVIYLHPPAQLPAEVSKAVRELKEYFAKARTNFTVRVNFSYGSDFQRHVWQELQKIPYGTTVSYEDIAMSLTCNDKLAARNLSRAVGSACADNPVPIFVPCHRVIGKDGRLVGFSGGVENKEFLLEHEIFGFFRDVQ